VHLEDKNIKSASRRQRNEKKARNDMTSLGNNLQPRRKQKRRGLQTGLRFACGRKGLRPWYKHFIDRVNKFSLSAAEINTFLTQDQRSWPSDERQGGEHLPVSHHHMPTPKKVHSINGKISKEGKEHVITVMQNLSLKAKKGKSREKEARIGRMSISQGIECSGFVSIQYELLEKWG